MFIFTRVGGGVTRTVASSWMSALKALVISTLDPVVSCAVARLSINLNNGTSRLVDGRGHRVFSPFCKVDTHGKSAFVLVVLV